MPTDTGHARAHQYALEDVEDLLADLAELDDAISDHLEELTRGGADVETDTGFEGVLEEFRNRVLTTDELKQAAQRLTALVGAARKRETELSHRANVKQLASDHAELDALEAALADGPPASLAGSDLVTEGLRRVDRILRFTNSRHLDLATQTQELKERARSLRTEAHRRVRQDDFRRHYQLQVLDAALRDEHAGASESRRTKALESLLDQQVLVHSQTVFCPALEHLRLTPDFELFRIPAAAVEGFGAGEVLETIPLDGVSDGELEVLAVLVSLPSYPTLTDALAAAKAL